MRRTQLLCFALVLALTTVAAADSISPTSQTWLDASMGQEITFQKEVTISQSSGSLIDVFFLFDVSGSMFGLVDQAKTSAAQLISDLTTTYGAGLAVGVGYYTDVPVSPFGLPPGTAADWEDTPWMLYRSITGDLAAAQTALSTVPNGNYAAPSLDVAEAQLYALKMAATEAGWRDGAAKILVWIGDEPGWDDSYGGFYPAAYATSVADAISALGSAGIIVEALSAGTGNGLDGSWNALPIGRGDITLGPGQASAIVTATGGDLGTLTGTSADLLAKILAAVEAGFEAYQSVGLDVQDAINAGLADIMWKQDGLAWGVDDNAPYEGDWDRSIERTFLFDVKLTVPNVDNIQYLFSIWGTLDNGRIVAELDRIVVGDIPINNEVPEPTTLALMGLGLLGVGIAARRKLRK